jgi:hypothetical protein
LRLDFTHDSGDLEITGMPAGEGLRYSALSRLVDTRMSGSVKPPFMMIA